MNALWEGGVATTSVDDLQRATGLGRSSIYHCFGSKTGLVERALERFVDEQLVLLSRAFEGRSLVQALEAIFLDIALCNHDGRGCLLVNSVGGLGRPDSQPEAPEFAAVRQGVQRLSARMTALVEATPQGVGRSGMLTVRILTVMGGLRTLQRGGFDAPSLQEAALRFAQEIAAAASNASENPVGSTVSPLSAAPIIVGRSPHNPPQSGNPP